MPITADDLQGMTTHWLGCPPNGYLGSGYGSGVRDLLQTPLSGPDADRLIAKLRTDIPIMGQLSGDALAITAEGSGADRLNLSVEVVGRAVPMAVAQFVAKPTGS